MRKTNLLTLCLQITFDRCASPRPPRRMTEPFVPRLNLRSIGITPNPGNQHKTAPVKAARPPTAPVSAARPPPSAHKPTPQPSVSRPPPAPVVSSNAGNGFRSTRLSVGLVVPSPRPVQAFRQSVNPIVHAPASSGNRQYNTARQPRDIVPGGSNGTDIFIASSAPRGADGFDLGSRPTVKYTSGKSGVPTKSSQTYTDEHMRAHLQRIQAVKCSYIGYWCKWQYLNKQLKSTQERLMQ